MEREKYKFVKVHRDYFNMQNRKPNLHMMLVEDSDSLCPTSFPIPRPNLPVTPGVS